ncbi:hypothetical protein [Xylanibacter rodentium]|uniref:tetratricopeptide repeat protein n=1 Tax=Xylanibacter rodentium TaxID=2736289 RepID=UPI00259B53BE|nr:hypothetical protein [Xylanibacter rodentium]
MSESQKARRALLQAYLATVWLVPADMTTADQNRAVTAFDGKCTTDEVKSLIIKSELAKADGNPVVRLEILKDAEFLASQLYDDKDLAFVYLYLSQVYGNGFNGIVSQHYANKALELFNKLGYRKQSIDARMAIVGGLVVRRDYATALDSLLSMKSDVLAYSSDSYKVYFLDQLARSLDENNRSEEAIEIWRGICDIDNGSPNILAHWAKAYLHANKPDSAEILINKAIALPHSPSDEYLCRNVQYSILERLGRRAELRLIDSLRNKAASIDYGERKIAESSLALNEKYESVTRSAWKEIESAKERAVIIISVFSILLLVLIGGILFYRKRIQLLKVENENNLLKLQSLEHNLFENERKHNIVSEKVAALFKSRFNTIDHLASAYFECKETGQEQKRIFGEAKSAIDSFGSAESVRELEDIVNTSTDNLMTSFDEDFPRLSVSQRKLALFIFCGLSLQSISIFLGTDLRNIYVYKSRLKSLISKSDIPKKEIYLSYFS